MKVLGKFCIVGWVLYHEEVKSVMKISLEMLNTFKDRVECFLCLNLYKFQLKLQNDIYLLTLKNIIYKHN